MAELAFSCFPNRIVSRNWTSNCGIAISVPDSKFQAKPVTTTYIHSHGTNLRQKWVHLRTRRWQPWLRNPRPCPAVNGLVSGFEEKGQMKELPLVLNSNGQNFRYAWDGYSLHAISAEYAKDSRITMQDLLVNLLRNIRIAIRRAFVPENVRCNYMSYIRWKFLHRVLSSILHVQATQAMLRALGFGAVRSLPSAAALNWVLKDGLGRLGRLICAAYFGHIFDSDLKKVRILTSLLYSMSLGLETLTPFFPQVFLLLATLANIGKSMSLAAYVATTSTIHKSFALGDNLAEISAKSQAQAVAADNVGLAMSICISLLCKHDPRLPLCLFPFLCTTELALIYKELQYVHFQTLNKVRLEIIIDRWVANGTIPSFEEVSKDEGLSLLGLSGNRQWPLRIGPPNVKLQKLEDLTDLLQQGEDQRYFLHFEHLSRLASKSLKDVPIGLYLWLRKDSSSSDIIMGTLQANYLRQMACEPNRDVRSESGNEAAACNPSKSRWSSLQEKSKLLATMNVQQLLRNMEMSGWATNYILLNHTERGTYNMNT